MYSSCGICWPLKHLAASVVVVLVFSSKEKWDSMTRRWRDNSIVQLVRLFLIDEVRQLMKVYALVLYLL